MTKKKICLVCSSGGHFLQLYSLKDVWGANDRFWVTFPGNDTNYFLKNETVYHAYFPTNRSLKNLVRNIFIAIKILKKEKPDVIISTGAGIAVPLIYLGRLFSIRTFYIESMTRVKDLSLSGKLIYPVVNHLLVQWPELAEKYKKTVYKGQVF